MFFPDNTRPSEGITRVSFLVHKTGRTFSIALNRAMSADGRIMGVKISTLENSPLPQGTELLGAMGELLAPKSEYLLPAGHNHCSFRDADGTSYPLFSVLEDGQLYFPTAAAIPHELGGSGLLMEDPMHHLE